MKNLSSERAQTTMELGLIFALMLIGGFIALSLAGQAVLHMWNGVITAWPA
jgi:hypothetical protein